MLRKWLYSLVASVLVCGLFGLAAHESRGQTSLATLATDARYDQGVREYQQRLIAHPRDDQARFSLAVLLYFRTTERIGQAFYRHGGDSSISRRLLNVELLDIPRNPKPEPIDYTKLREYLSLAKISFEEIIRTTGEITSKDVTVKIDMEQISLDFNQNGQIEQHERYATQQVILRQFDEDTGEEEDERPMNLGQLDRIDLLQIRSTCCTSLAAIDCALAYNFELMWQSVAPRGFSGASPSYDFVNEELNQSKNDRGHHVIDSGAVSDLIVAFHQMRFQLMDRRLMKEAHEQLLLANQAQQERWKLLEDWSSNEENQALSHRIVAARHLTFRYFPLEFTRERMNGLEQLDQILRGRLLLRFWRGTNEERGVNVRRFFLEPPSELDFIMVTHGGAMAPYIEMGDCSEQDALSMILEAARGFAFIDPFRMR